MADGHRLIARVTRCQVEESTLTASGWVDGIDFDSSEVPILEECISEIDAAEQRMFGKLEGWGARWTAALVPLLEPLAASKGSLLLGAARMKKSLIAALILLVPIGWWAMT